MGRTVEELRRSLSRRELTHWMAFSELEPFGPLPSYAQAGAICSTIVNAMPFRGKDSPTLTPSDFFSVLDAPPADEDPEVLSRKLDKALFGGI